MADAALDAAQWVVGKALAPVADGVLEAWTASSHFGLNIEALRPELLQVQAMLERAATKELVGPATEKLLQNLQDSAHNAEDLLDELDYFRIHDKLHNTYEAADEHGKGCVCNLVLNARHTAKALRKQMASLCMNCFGANASHPRQEDARQNVSCCTWQRGRQRSKMSAGHFPSAPNANPVDQEVSGCMPKLGKPFQGSSSPHPHVSGVEACGSAQETPMPEFNRVEFSRRMKEAVEQLKLRSEEVNKILTHCGPRTVLDIAQRRPATTPQSAEPKLYGRDRVINSMIHDITEGQYCDMGLTVLPVIGPGGMGKTTLIQHIYNNQQVQNHFPVRIWICVSFSFNLGKVLEQIKEDTLRVEGENGCSTTQELIEHRLKHKRFLLVLDDIWQFTDVDDWKKLLLMLGKSQEKGSMVLVTTRQKNISDQVKKTVEPKELNGLEPGEFRKLFLVYVFDAEQYPGDKLHLRDTGDEIMGKLKCSPLAAKTVGRLLRTDHSFAHWRRVLNSKQWTKQTNGIMHALELSYDFLPFHLQRCFSYSALFPEDYRFRGRELISLWIGLDILTPCGQNPTFEGIGLSILNDLVIHGFFIEEENDGDLRYVMHDLLHDLALKVASHDCLSLCLPNVGSMEIQPSIRHLSISMEDLGKYDAMSAEKLKSELEELKTRFKVEDLQTLMLFGKMDEGFVKIFGDFFEEVNALRILHLPRMLCPVESMLHNFSRLVHLRCLCLVTYDREMHLPPSISKFYHLRILDLVWWCGSCDLPQDMSNLAKLCHFYVGGDGELHSEIYNVGKIKLLEELKVFRVNKKSEGFEPKQLEHLSKLRELGIYNLEKIHTEEEAAQAKLIEKNCLRRLTLDWDSKRSSVEPGVEAAVLESLQPHGDLQVLCIRGHGGPSCPTWLGDEFAVKGLQSLYLDGVSWEVFPSLGKAWDLHELRFEHIARPKDFIIEKSFCRLIKLTLIGLGSFQKWVYTGEQEFSVGGDLLPPTAHMFPHLQVLIIRECPRLSGLPFPNHIVSPDWFPKLQELEVTNCRVFSSVILISWIESLRRVMMRNVKLLAHFLYSKSSNGAGLEITGEADLHSIDQVLVFDKETGLETLRLDKCPPLESKHLLMLTSLKKLIVVDSDCLVGPLGGGQGDVEWQLPVEYMQIDDLNGNTGKELTELLPHLPRLSELEIWRCKNIKKLVVGVDVQQTTLEASEMGGGEITTAAEEEDDGVLLFPPHLSDSLLELEFYWCEELVLVNLPTLVPGGGGLQALGSLQRLRIQNCLQPHEDLQVLCIRGHGGSSCPTWLGDEFVVEALQSLYLDGVSWEVFPSLGKAWDLHEIRLVDIARPKEFIIEECFCRLTQLTLIGLGSLEKWVYTGEQESSMDGELLPPDSHMFPLLQVLIIRECPRLLGLPFPNHIVSPDWFPKLEELEVTGCPEFSSVILISWIESLRRVMMKNVKLLESFWYSKSSNGAELKIIGEADLHSIDQVLVFDKETGLERLALSRCPPLELKHLLMLTSLKTLIVADSDWLVGPLGGGQSDVEWQLPVEYIKINGLNGNTGEELTELLPHLPKLSKLEIGCKNIKKLVVGVDVQQTTSEASEMGGGEITAAAEEEDDGVLFFPAHLSDSLQELEFDGCSELVLVDPPTLVPGGGALQALRSLERLTIQGSPKFLSTFSFSCHIFPSSLQFLTLSEVEDMGTLEPLSNLSSLTRLELYGCGGDLKCQGLWSLVTTGGRLKELNVRGSPRFFADWDPNPRRALEQQTQLVSSTLRELETDDIEGLLAAPVCRFLSSSLTKLALYGHGSRGMERFSKEQDDALQLLSSLQQLDFSSFKHLQQLPAGLHNLITLKVLSVKWCPAVSSLPNDALPDSLEMLDVYGCSEELNEKCSGLVGTIPKIMIDFRSIN